MHDLPPTYMSIHCIIAGTVIIISPLLWLPNAALLKTSCAESCLRFLNVAQEIDISYEIWMSTENKNKTKTRQHQHTAGFFWWEPQYFWHWPGWPHNSPALLESGLRLLMERHLVPAGCHLLVGAGGQWLSLQAVEPHVLCPATGRSVIKLYMWVHTMLATWLFSVWVNLLSFSNKVTHV